MNGIIYKNGFIVDPANNREEIGDIAILDGKIVDPSTLTNPEIKDITGLHIAPGFIDIHVHLREPGQTHKEDIATGTAAAAAGGFTTVVAMPNTIPAIDSAENYKIVQNLIKQKALVNVIQSACLTINRQGTELTDFAALKDAGVIILTDDGTTLQNDYLMLQAFKKAAEFNLPISDHCEHENLAHHGVMNDGKVSQELGLPGKSRSAEEIIVARNILFSRITGCAAHIQHISSGDSVRMIREAQKEGLKVTAEATPHHILGTDEWVKTYGANAKMNPPLCLESDRQEIIKGILDGTISCLVTDHAPHTEEEKAVGMLKAPAGIVGIECAFALCATELYHNQKMNISKFIACYTQNPRQVIPGIEGGTLSVGAKADIAIFDLNKEYQIDIKTFKSKSANCPYDKFVCRGKIVETLVNGKIVYKS